MGKGKRAAGETTLNIPFSFVFLCTQIIPYVTTNVTFSSGILKLRHPLHMLVLILNMNETICNTFKHNREQSKFSHRKWV